MIVWWPALLILFLTFLLGLIMGSFLHCFGFRYATGESVAKGRSHCALCGHTLHAADLVPLLSYLFLRGKCRYCGKAVSKRYPVAELVCGLAYLSVLLRFGISADLLQYLIFVSLLFGAAVTDLYCRLIPDRLILMGIITAFGFGLGSPEGILSALGRILLNGLSVAGPLLLLVLLFDKVMKRETMGGGDIKLMFMIGLFFDWRLNLLILILACCIGLLAALLPAQKAEDGSFSFGPALCLAAWMVMLWGEGLLRWYLGLF